MNKYEIFINGILPIVRNEYISREKWILPSVVIAQAILESGWNLSAKSLFGIKGNDFTATTSEFYDGNKVIIEAGFKYYPDIYSSVCGYFDLITNSPLYKKVVNESDYKKAVDGLINTGYGYGYATAPNYVETVIDIIEYYELYQYDVREETKPTVTKKSNEEIAKEVIRGKWGNGSERKERLTASGYDFDTIQKIVDNMLNGTKPTVTKKSNEEIAKEVIRGKWGNGSERKDRLTASGYDFDTIQKIVDDYFK